MQNWSLQMALHDNAQNCEFLIVNRDTTGNIQLHSHQFVEIEYILRGSLVQIINGVEYEVNQGDIVYLNVGDCHEFHPKGGKEDVEVLNIMFITDNIFTSNDTPAHKAGNLPNMIHLQNTERNEIENLIFMLEQEYEVCDGLSNVILKNLMMALVSILVRHSGTTNQNYGKDFDRIVSFVDDNFSSACLEKTATKFGYNSSYFSRFFEKNMGVNFSNYVAEKRINLSKNLLVNTNDSIDVISYKCGFNSQSAFYRMFQKKTGMTPKKYRQLKRGTK